VTTGYITWTWNGKAVRVGFDRVGEASTVLLLPAFSSISTQQKMRPLQERLASEFAAAELPRGKLAVNEEFPDAVVEKLNAILREFSRCMRDKVRSMGAPRSGHKVH
jgi:hypothetical protein